MSFTSAKALKMPSVPASGKLVFNPHDYQRAGIEWLVTKSKSGLFYDPGLGKTICVLQAFDIRREKKICDKMLVIAPLLVAKHVWTDEIKKWGLLFKAVVLHGSKKDKLLQEEADVYIINYDGLEWFLKSFNPKRWKKAMLVIDESSKIKSTRTRRFKALKRMLPAFPYRHILTGSPVPNSLLDLFGQIYALDQGNALGQYVTHYRQQYFFQTGFGGYEWKILPGSSQRIYDKIAPLVMRIDAQDHIQLPKLVRAQIDVVLPDRARMIYDDLERDFITQLRNGVIIAKNAGVLSGKLRQVANGGIYHEQPGEKRRSEWLHDAKVDALVELIEELQGKPAWIAYYHQHELARLKEVFPQAEVMNPHDATIVKRWNAGEISVLLGHPQSAAHGLNMQGSGYAIIFFALTWSFEDFDQFVRRVWRQGLKSRVFLYTIVAKNTIDDVILGTLMSKKATQNDLFIALKKKYLTEAT